MTAQKRKPNRLLRFNSTKVNLFLDIALALAFVVVLEERFSGLRLHELIGVGLGAALVVHLILHWRWILSIMRTFFKNLFHGSRFNYLLNIVLFADLLIVTVTGIGISRTLGLNLGLSGSLMQTFRQLHVLGSNFSLMIVGLHVALHWRWIASNAQRYLLRLPFHRAPKAATVPVAFTRTTQQPVGGVQ